MAILPSPTAWKDGVSDRSNSSLERGGVLLSPAPFWDAGLKCVTVLIVSLFTLMVETDIFT